MQCLDEQIEPMLRVCKVCGLPARTDRPIKRECKGPPVNEKPTKPMPSLLARAGNFARSMAKAAADGFAQVAAEDLAARTAICGTCDRFDGTTCRECGCVGNWKARLRSQDCPLGLWPDITT